MSVDDEIRVKGKTRGTIYCSVYIIVGVYI